ncbi:uncharacterized protein LOC117301141 [Asterias rubens]|uniref:uncharacterized protein LOC117301141 n=1 Tax=Asterias rubens TaxID=7604 RepID=UPI001455D17D|nr:uncharacterized protein LOC117301141 [Asterias rubens]
MTPVCSYWLALASLNFMLMTGTVAQTESLQDSSHLRNTDDYSNATGTCENYDSQMTCAFKPPQPLCFCDDLCTKFNDCCKDPPETASSKPASSLQRLTGNDLRPSNETTSDVFTNLDYHACVVVPTEIAEFTIFRGWYTQPYGVWMVSKCPPSWNDVIIRNRCEAPSVGDFDLMVQLPFASHNNNMTSFRNIYCVLCHSLQLSSVMSWDIKISAAVLQDWKADNYSVSMIEILKSSPNLDRTQPNIQFVPTDLSSRACLPNIIDACPVGYDNQFVIGQCKSYMNAAVNPLTKVIYRNWYCALCNGGIDPQINICNSFRLLPSLLFTTPLTAVIDFRESESLHSYFGEEFQTACEEGEFLDPFSLRCRVLQCPLGFGYEDGVCLQKASSALEDDITDNQNCLSPSYMEIEVVVCGHDDENPCESLSKCLQMSSQPDIPIHRCVSKLENVQKASDFNCSSVVRIIQTVNTTVHNLSDVIENMFGCPFMDTVHHLSVKIGCLSSSNISCYDYNTSDDSDVYLTSWNNSGVVYVRHFNGLYSLEETVYQITYIQKRNKSLSKEYKLAICGEPIQLNCSLVALDSSDFVLKEDAQRTDTNYLILDTGGALVCHYLVSIKEPGVHGLTIVTLIGIILSMLALVASFITYLVFKTIRNLPGKCVMSLIVAVFLSQFLLLITGDDVAKSVSKASCTVLAVFLHYSILATFSWTNALALYLARTLGPKAKPAAATQHRKSFLMYSIFGWGAPCPIIIICIIIYASLDNALYGVSVGVNGTRSCYIIDRYARLLASLIPICASLVTNAALFVWILTGFTFRRTPSAKLYSKKVQKSRARRDVLISLKIGFLLAFTWIFNLLAIAVDSEPLMYIFCILTSIQGVYIFLAFTFTKQVRALWREKLGLKQESTPGRTNIQKGKKVLSSSHEKKDLCGRHSPSEHIDTAQ